MRVGSRQMIRVWIYGLMMISGLMMFTAGCLTPLPHEPPIITSMEHALAWMLADTINPPSK